MKHLKTLQSTLTTLQQERTQITENWYLQNCWLTQSQPGGTARTDHKYWLVRSRRPMFDGKTIKYLQADEVEDYRTAIQRGRQLKQLDRQIKDLQKQIAKLRSTTSSSETLTPTLSPLLPVTSLPAVDQSQALKPKVKFVDLAEQKRVVEEILADSQGLRASLRQALAVRIRLSKRNQEARNTEITLSLKPPVPGSPGGGR